jgi:protein arginine kinase
VTGQRLTDNDIVISSRINLARNIADFPFVCTCSSEQLEEIKSTVLERLGLSAEFADVSFDENLETSFEKQLLADIESLGHCGAMGHSFSSDPDSLQSKAKVEFENGSVAIKINEEDHFRISATRHDGDLLAAWNRLTELDDLVEQYFSYAFSEQWGYLTTSPADIGTGMRIHATLFLPGLASTGGADQLFRELQRKNLIVRSAPRMGAVDEPNTGANTGLIRGDQTPDLFRISNLNTLGVTEVGLIEHFENSLPPIMQLERQARDVVLARPQSAIEMQVTDAVSEICQMTLAGNEDKSRTNLLLSRIRFGISIGLVSDKSKQNVLQSYSLVSQRRQLTEAIANENYSLAADIRDKIRYLEDQLGQGDADSGEL